MTNDGGCGIIVGSRPNGATLSWHNTMHCKVFLREQNIQKFSIKSQNFVQYAQTDFSSICTKFFHNENIFCAIYTNFLKGSSSICTILVRIFYADWRIIPHFHQLTQKLLTLWILFIHFIQYSDNNLHKEWQIFCIKYTKVFHIRLIGRNAQKKSFSERIFRHFKSCIPSDFLI